MQNLDSAYCVIDHNQATLKANETYFLILGGHGSSAGGYTNGVLVRNGAVIGEASEGYSIADSSFFGSSGGAVKSWHKIGDITENGVMPFARAWNK